MTTRPRTFDHLKSAKKPIEQVVPIHHDDDLLAAYEDAGAALGRAELLAEDGDDASALRIAELREAKDRAAEALRAETTFLTFRSIGRRAYQDLIEDNPPTAEQRVQHKEDHGVEAPYNDETFAPALVAACCVDPKTGEPTFTVEEVAQLFEEWNSSEVIAMYQAAINVNNRRRVSDLGKQSGPTRGSARS